MKTSADGEGPLVLVVNPGADRYGSDLQLLETISGLVERGWRVLVVVPHDGPLVSLLEGRGARVVLRPFPALRRAHASLTGVAKLAWRGGMFVASARRLTRQYGADAVYVNTVTIPWWILGGRLAGAPTLCHVHEAETQDGAVVRFALAAPLVAASRILVNSRAAMDATCRSAPGLRRRARLVYNGVPGPPDEPARPQAHEGPYRLVVISRLSPRKRPDTAIRALALLRERGVDVTLEVIGTAFAGYEWYAGDLRALASELGVASSLTWHGYVSPIWKLLSESDVVIAPSRLESFGNVVVEAQLAARPVVATAVSGHLETIVHERTGLHFPLGDAEALASAVKRLIDDPCLAERLAREGRHEALRRFSPERYRHEVADAVQESASRPVRR
jgi:glycosyltransferase involved in cell wall biosynthesis